VKTDQSLRLGTWLRWLGTTSFVVAAASFLVEGWTDPGVLKRELLWAVGTLAMTLCGIVCIRRYRDAIGARVFLGLAAATIPAHFAQVGAAVWTLRHEGIGTTGEALAAFGTLLALAPPLALGISALVRRRARLLTSLMFVMGAPLLVPTRDGTWIAVLGAVELGLGLCMEAALFRREALFRSVEGMAARALLFVPCAILLVRNAFYPSTPIWLAALIGYPCCALLVLPRVWSQQGRLWAAVQALGALGVCAALVIAVPQTPWLGFLLSGVALLASEFIAGRPVAFAWSGTVLLALSAVLSLLDSNVWSALFLVPAATVHALVAYRRRSAPRLLGVGGITLLGVVGHLMKLVHLPKHDVWIPALAVSVAFLALASIVDQRRAQIERNLLRLRNHFSAREGSSHEA
jgi:hypothetical protein